MGNDLLLLFLLEIRLSKKILRELLFFAFVTFFARPKKVTKEKTPKSNARDGFPRACRRFQPFCALVLSLAEIGTHAITFSAHGRDFGFPSAQILQCTASWAYSMDSHSICTFLIEFCPFLRLITYFGRF
jgi:hypothetical protein